ncbi:hypothetical protein [Faecalispora jeddahensis]|uniref:hypothetical protein n=1 Tax=Faecalispora jeddahensis TaxID=1414721 RepID=UPI0028AF2B24|nr:hypothetical protein [Faecalispora jeddahensis]
MALIDQVKPRIGVFYSTPEKNTEVQGMIDGAVAIFRGGGWIIDPASPSPDAVEAIILYCKMAQSTDPALLTNHPVIISLIAQGRSGGA